MADPGVPARAAGATTESLRAELVQHLDDADWDVELSKETLPLSPDGHILLMDHAQDLRDRYGWDYIVYLTDLPRHHNEKPLLCEVSVTRSCSSHLCAIGTSASGSIRPSGCRLRVSQISGTEDCSASLDGAPSFEALQVSPRTASSCGAGPTGSVPDGGPVAARAMRVLPCRSRCRTRGGVRKP